jgi:hypothetical protein
MRRYAIAFLLALPLAVPAGDAGARPKRADGGQCDTVGTERRNGRDEQGNTVSCTWDSCTYSECSTTGGQVSNCVKKTEYSNPRDCTAARSVPKSTIAPGGVIPKTMKLQ